MGFLKGVYPIAKEVSNVCLFPTDKKFFRKDAFFWKFVSFFYARCCRLSKQFPEREKEESKATFVGWEPKVRKYFVWCRLSATTKANKNAKMSGFALAKEAPRIIRHAC